MNGRVAASGFSTKMPANRCDLCQTATARHAELDSRCTGIADEFAAVALNSFRVFAHFLFGDVDADVMNTGAGARGFRRVGGLIVKTDNGKIKIAVGKMRRLMIAF